MWNVPLLHYNWLMNRWQISASKRNGKKHNIQMEKKKYKRTFRLLTPIQMQLQTVDSVSHFIVTSSFLWLKTDNFL